MNGVDKCAQYPFSRRTVKWWKKAFVRLFELPVRNAMMSSFMNTQILPRCTRHIKSLDWNLFVV